MSENALDRKGELGKYSSRPNQKLTHQCERASGILHPWSVSKLILFEIPAVSNNLDLDQA